MTKLEKLQRRNFLHLMTGGTLLVIGIAAMIVSGSYILAIDVYYTFTTKILIQCGDAVQFAAHNRMAIAWTGIAAVSLGATFLINVAEIEAVLDRTNEDVGYDELKQWQSARR